MDQSGVETIIIDLKNEQKISIYRPFRQIILHAVLLTVTKSMTNHNK